MFCFGFCIVTWIAVSLTLLCHWIGRKDPYSAASELAAILATFSGIALIGGDVLWGSWNYIQFYGGRDHILACTASSERCEALSDWMWQIDQFWFGPQAGLIILFGCYAVWDENKKPKTTDR